MKREIFYLISGPAHLPYLITSLWALKDHWQGDVIIHAWPESYDLIKQMDLDIRLPITNVCKREPAYRGKNSQFLDKIIVAQESKADITLYLDADTIVQGCLDPLFEYADQYGFAATQFCDWVTTGRTIGRRIKDLEKFIELDQSLIEIATKQSWPSVNGGVWATRPSSSVLPLWYEWTMAAKTTFIADEKVLHLMMLKFSSTREMVVLCANGKWNCSPLHQSEKLADGDVIIRHFHGDSNVRPRKTQKGFDLWEPLYRECLELNVGGIADWIGTIKNKHMRRAGLLP